MKIRTLSLLVCLSALLHGVAQTYRNPVIAGYHPDPSVCRVGDDYYLVNSSFEYFPGVPLFHSRDLVHWEQIGNVLDRDSQLPLKGASSWTGIYAPTIRYNKGTYYMITTNVGNGGNFMVTAKDPRGPWSEPIWLEQQGIDPSLFFENGRCYMVSNPDNTIMLCQINPRTGKQITPSRPLWQGTGGRYPEGPHLYKKDGYYYLLISEGGTELAHRLTIARSKKIEGPYEANPDNPLLTHCSMAGQTNPIQGTGHGDFVQTKDGDWWLVLLGYRNFNGSYHHLGRETFLAPVEWKKGEWPVVNSGLPIDTLMKAPLLSSLEGKNSLDIADDEPISLSSTQGGTGGGLPDVTRHIRTTFDQSLGPEWVYIQNPDSTKYNRYGGKLRLVSSQENLTANDRPTFVGRRQESDKFQAETRVDFFESLADDEAGLSVYQINDGHLDFCIKPNEEGGVVALKLTMKSVEVVLKKKFIDVRHCTLRVRSDGVKYYFEYALDDGRFELLESVDCALMSTEVVGGFTGVVIGMYCWLGSSNQRSGSSYADFEYFDYVED